MKTNKAITNPIIPTTIKNNVSVLTNLLPSFLVASARRKEKIDKNIIPKKTKIVKHQQKQKTPAKVEK
jgi:hypothetical protein